MHHMLKCIENLCDQCITLQRCCSASVVALSVGRIQTKQCLLTPIKRTSFWSKGLLHGVLASLPSYPMQLPLPVSVYFLQSFVKFIWPPTHSFPEWKSMAVIGGILTWWMTAFRKWKKLCRKWDFWHEFARTCWVNLDDLTLNLCCIRTSS